MIADTWLLIMLRWQVGWNGFRSRKPVGKILTVVAGVWFALVAAGISSFVGVGGGILLRQFSNRQYDALIPGVILTAVGFILLLSSFGIALGSLFLASDLDLLMSAPVDRRAVFVSKILDGVALYYVLAAIIALPALVTYGIGLGYNLPYYFLAIVAVLGTPLLPAGLGALLVMLVARLAPARRVREVLGLMGALFGLSCGLLSQTSRLWARQVFSNTGRPEGWVEGLGALQQLPIPPMIAGRGLAAAGQGDWTQALLYTTVFLTFTFGAFAACIWLADKLYASGWLRMQSSGTSTRGKQKSAEGPKGSGLLGRASAATAIMLKDWRVVPRDLRNFAQMLSPLLFLPIVYINLVGGRRGGISDSPGRLFSSTDWTGVIIAVGVLVSTVLVFSRLAGTSISMEGKSWWLLKAAPISGAELLRGKYLSVMIPFAVLSTLLLFGAALWRGASAIWLLYGWFGVETLGAGMLAVELGLAVPWARLDWDDPRKMASGLGALLSILIWGLLAATSGVLLCLPLLAEAFQPRLVLEAAIVGGLLSSLVTLAVSYVALKIGVSRLAMVGEA